MGGKFPQDLTFTLYTLEIVKREIFSHTDKAFIAGLPRFTFNGRIVVICGETDAAIAIKALRTLDLVGFDTETRPSFRPGKGHQVALLQLSGKDVCFLFRLCRIGLPDCVVDFLNDARIRKVGLSLGDDFRALQRRRNFTPKGFIDLQNCAADLGIEDRSLQKLFANLFHRRISKGARLSNWEADILSESQQIYAATDAFACIELYEEMGRLKSSHDFIVIKDSATTQPHTNQHNPITHYS